MVPKYKILLGGAAVCFLWWLLAPRHQEDPIRTSTEEQYQSGTMLLGAVGDILLHREHQELAFRLASYRPLWAPIDDILGKVPHLLYGNFEGTSSPRSYREPKKFSYDSLDECKDRNISHFLYLKQFFLFHCWGGGCDMQ